MLPEVRLHCFRPPSTFGAGDATFAVDTTFTWFVFFTSSCNITDIKGTLALGGELATPALHKSIPIVPYRIKCTEKVEIAHQGAKCVPGWLSRSKLLASRNFVPFGVNLPTLFFFDDVGVSSTSTKGDVIGGVVPLPGVLHTDFGDVLLSDSSSSAMLSG